MKKWAKFFSNGKKKGVFGFGGGASKQDKRIFGASVTSIRGAGFVDTCIYHLEQHGLTAEGIFRIAGNAVDVANMKVQFETGKRKNFTTEDSIYDVGAMLKMYYRELQPEPLMTFDLYEAFMAAMQEHGKEKTLVSKLLSLTPVPNLLLLGKLMGFLKKVAQPQNRNKMDARNLAICFGPNLLYPRVETMETVIGNAMHVTNLITMFIEEYDFYFNKISKLVEGLDDEDDDDEVEESSEENNDGKKSKKQLEKEQKEKDEKELKRRQEKHEKLQQGLANDRKRDEEAKRVRLERKRLLEQQWQDISKGTFGTIPKGPSLSEEEKQAIQQTRKEWKDKSKIIGKPLSPEESRLKREKAQKEKREREEKENKERQEQLQAKKEMETSYKDKMKQSIIAQNEQRELAVASGTLTVEEFYKMQQGKFVKIKAGQYTYEDLMAWHNELERLKEKMNQKANAKEEPSVNPARVVLRSLSTASGVMKGLAHRNTDPPTPAVGTVSAPSLAPPSHSSKASTSLGKTVGRSISMAIKPDPPLSGSPPPDPRSLKSLGFRSTIAGTGVNSTSPPPVMASSSSPTISSSGSTPPPSAPSATPKSPRAMPRSVPPTVAAKIAKTIIAKTPPPVSPKIVSKGTWTKY